MTTPGNADDDLALFERFAQHRDRKDRNALVERYMGLAVHIAKGFRRGRPSDDDIRQVAMLGLVKAVDRFDPSLGYPFAAFARSTIEGELKRHARDHTWVVRVPRSGKELHLLVRRATDELTAAAGRSPTVAEIAEHLRIDRDDVLRGLSASAAYDVDSLDRPPAGSTDQRSTHHAAALTSTEAGFDAFVDGEVVAGLIAKLPEREREIVTLRFFERLTQQQIADKVGVSQMHVSRLLRRSLDLMRSMIEPD
ncbi:MAG: SigB/SigF/SigG family RNA polymerase sigma factor [Acidimicrobiia bacterium]